MPSVNRSGGVSYPVTTGLRTIQSSGMYKKLLMETKRIRCTVYVFMSETLYDFVGLDVIFDERDDANVVVSD